MGIVEGNEPPRKRSGGGFISWIFLLLVFGPTIWNVVRGMTGGVISDEQLMIAVGGIVGLVALALIVQRVGRSRNEGAPRLPTPASYQPQVPRRSSAARINASLDRPFQPPTPRYEPMITGKVLLLGLVFAGAWLGLAFLLFIR